MSKLKLLSMERFIRAFSNSFEGLKSALKTEIAFQQEVILAILFIPVALWLPHTAVEKAILIGSILLILIVELINTAIEAVVDRISSEQHPLSKKAKDIGSTAVFIAFINAIALWLIILL